MISRDINYKGENCKKKTIFKKFKKNIALMINLESHPLNKEKATLPCVIHYRYKSGLVVAAGWWHWAIVVYFVKAW